MYQIYKVSHKYERYLNIIPMRLRCYFTRLRLSLHPLRIQTGRYNNNRIDVYFVITMILKMNIILSVYVHYKTRLEKNIYPQKILC